jgi:hypothetical protein
LSSSSRVVRPCPCSTGSTESAALRVWTRSLSTLFSQLAATTCYNSVLVILFRMHNCRVCLRPSFSRSVFEAIACLLKHWSLALPPAPPRIFHSHHPFSNLLGFLSSLTRGRFESSRFSLLLSRTGKASKSFGSRALGASLTPRPCSSSPASTASCWTPLTPASPIVQVLPAPALEEALFV